LEAHHTLEAENADQTSAPHEDIDTNVIDLENTDDETDNDDEESLSAVTDKHSTNEQQSVAEKQSRQREKQVVFLDKKLITLRGRNLLEYLRPATPVRRCTVCNQYDHKRCSIRQCLCRVLQLQLNSSTPFRDWLRTELESTKTSFQQLVCDSCILTVANRLAEPLEDKPAELAARVNNIVYMAMEYSSSHADVVLLRWDQFRQQRAYNTMWHRVAQLKEVRTNQTQQIQDLNEQVRQLVNQNMELTRANVHVVDTNVNLVSGTMRLLASAAGAHRVHQPQLMSVAESKMTIEECSDDITDAAPIREESKVTWGAYVDKLVEVGIGRLDKEGAAVYQQMRTTFKNSGTRKKIVMGFSNKLFSNTSTIENCQYGPTTFVFWFGACRQVQQCVDDYNNSGRRTISCCTCTANAHTGHLPSQRQLLLQSA